MSASYNAEPREAGGPVCSPTRATVLTGRTHDRTGVFAHGYAVRCQEKTLAAAMQKAGYATGQFGKWHLHGLRGPGVPSTHSDQACGKETPCCHNKMSRIAFCRNNLLYMRNFVISGTKKITCYGNCMNCMRDIDIT